MIVTTLQFTIMWLVLVWLTSQDASTKQTIKWMVSRQGLDKATPVSGCGKGLALFPRVTQTH